MNALVDNIAAVSRQMPAEFFYLTSFSNFQAFRQAILCMHFICLYDGLSYLK